ncbi:MAG: metallophosphoesterase family protein [Bacteroidales bacterium]
MGKILLTLNIILFFVCFGACSENESFDADSWKKLKFPQDTPIIPRFDQNNNFRILQLTDIHYDQSDYENTIQQNIKDLVTLSNPDLIILTGDIVTGQPATFRWVKFALFLAELKVPYLITLGNHDSQYLLSREDLYEMIRGFSYCLNNEYEDPEAFLPGDMAVPVLSRQSEEPETILYLFDSNDYNNPEKQVGMRPAQTEWFKNKSSRYKAADLNNALVFMHVPLPQYREATDKIKQGWVGNRGENECVGLDGDGFFEALKHPGNVYGIFCGHDHYNDYVIKYEGIALCYGRKSGSHNTYQRYPSGGRIIDLHAGEKGFSTYIIDCAGNRTHAYQFIP